MISRASPGLVFVSETKLEGAWARGVRYKVSMENFFVVDCMGWNGRLLLLWMDDIEVSIINFSKWHIDAWVKLSEGAEWRFTGFYRNPTRSQRKFSWEILRRLSST